jgi:3-oxoacyl-[acyl-carrier protein] reductase/pteridine reductase
MEVKGRTALITGGAHRVGRAITLGLARAGANVIVNYHSSVEAADKTTAEARAFGVKALAYQANIADSNEVESMMAAARDTFGFVDILVNSASDFTPFPFPTSDFSVWHRTINVLIHGPFYCANALAPSMLARGEGNIINIIDQTAVEPWPQFGPHGVGKAGLLAFTRQLALELAPHVRANAVSPGPSIPPTRLNEVQRQRLARRNLLGRWGGGEEVAKAVLYLIDADFVTGEVIVVDGGERYGPGRFRFRDHDEGQ